LSETLAQVQALVARGNFLVSDHAYDKLVKGAIVTRDVLAGIFDAQVVEDYPLAARGPSVLVFQRDASGRPLHVVWGIPKDLLEPAVIVTAYRPDAKRWSADLMKRITR
jgi:hypothetical protein